MRKSALVRRREHGHVKLKETEESGLLKSQSFLLVQVCDSCLDLLGILRAEVERLIEIPQRLTSVAKLLIHLRVRQTCR